MPKDTFHNLNPNKKQRIMQAAVDEFGNHSYEEAKLSRIIKAADIARGSFYQYFEDKADLYQHLFHMISQEKIKFLGPQINNPDEIPFIDLFRQLMKSGLKFAAENPDYIKITRNLMHHRGHEIFQKVMGDGFELAKQYYRNYIETDKKYGRIRADVDTNFLADIIMETSSNLSFMELSKEKDFDLNKMFHRLEQFLHILQKGIE